MLSFTIAGAGMYLLARELTGSRAAAAVAGLYYAFCPMRMAQVSHLQMVATGWIPVALWGLHRYFSTRRVTALAIVVAAWALQIVSNLYAGYFVVMALVAVGVDGLAHARGTRLPDALRLAAAAALFLVVVAPIGAAYYRVRHDYQQVRSIEEIAATEADLRSYIVGKNSVGVWRWLPTMVTIDPERELFPGIFAVAIAACAFARHDRDERRRRWARLYGVIAVAAIAVSLGPHVRVWGHLVTTHGPYAWLLHLVPGMDGMRVPARMAIVFVAALSALVALGTARLLDRLPPSRRGIAAAILGVAVVADGVAAPLIVLPYSARGRPDDRAVADWLRTVAPGPVIHLPVTESHELELHHQFATLFHGDPIVNGFSGYATPLHEFLVAPASPLNDPALADGVADFVSGLGVRYVAVHFADYDAIGGAGQTIDALRRSARVVREARLAGAEVFEIAPPPGPGPSPLSPIDARQLTLSASEGNDRLAMLVDGDRDSRWFAGLGGQDGSSWIAIAMPPADVARVDLQFAERSWRDFPRRLRIDSTDAGGATRTLYDAAPLLELGAALAADARYPSLEIRLPANASVRLTLRQTAAVPAAWSVHELRLWRR